MLSSDDWQFFTDVLGQFMCPIFKGKCIYTLFGCDYWNVEPKNITVRGLFIGSGEQYLWHHFIIYNTFSDTGNYLLVYYGVPRLEEAMSHPNENWKCGAQN